MSSDTFTALDEIALQGRHIAKPLQHHITTADSQTASQINSLPEPRASQLSVLQHEINDPANAFLRNAELDTWADPKAAAYMILHSKADDDQFTRSVEDFVTGPYHRYVGHHLRTGKLMDAETGTRSYNNRHAAKAGAIVATILSATFPVLTIFVLNRLPTTDQRLGLTVLFTALFAIMLLTFSSARKAEIFAATAT